MAEKKGRSSGGETGVSVAGDKRSNARNRPRGDVPSGALRARARSQSPTGPGTRAIAVSALILGVVVMFMVLTTSGEPEPTTKASNGGTESSERASGESARDSGGDAASEPTGSTADLPATYKVKPGDSFAAIAEKTGVEVNALAELNPDVDPRALQPGQKLKLR